MDPPKPLKEGQVFRSCRLYEEEKPQVFKLSPPKSANKTEKNGDMAKKDKAVTLPQGALAQKSRNSSESDEE